MHGGQERTDHRADLRQHLSASIWTCRFDYYTDCAETEPYLPRPIPIRLASGQPIQRCGRFRLAGRGCEQRRAGGTVFCRRPDAIGVSEGVANPVADVLSELSAQVGSGASYTFVGTTDHPVSCLNYGDNTPVDRGTGAHAQRRRDGAHRAGTGAGAHAGESLRRAFSAWPTGKSSDHTGEGAVIVYVDESANAAVPQPSTACARSVIPTTAQAVAHGHGALEPFAGSRAGCAPGRGAQPGRARQAADCGRA